MMICRYPSCILQYPNCALSCTQDRLGEGAYKWYAYHAEETSTKDVSAVTASTKRDVVRCLNPKCGTPLPGRPLQMNSFDIRETRDQRAGDIGICGACGMIMIFTGIGNMVRKPSETEAKLIGANKEVMEARDAILQRLVRTPPDMV